MSGMQPNPYESPREATDEPAAPMSGIVLEAFRSLEPVPQSPKDDQPHESLLPIVIGNICWIAVGLLVVGLIWWAFGSVIAARSTLFVGSAFFSLARLLAWLGKI